MLSSINITQLNNEMRTAYYDHDHAAATFILVSTVSTTEVF